MKFFLIYSKGLIELDLELLNNGTTVALPSMALDVNYLLILLKWNASNKERENVLMIGNVLIVISNDIVLLDNVSKIVVKANFCKSSKGSSWRIADVILPSFFNW